ncbi:MarR family winged helix-turn-helix transcriptional regulator [Zhenhengia yiwuensis]|uniref:MarR family transcriptional regulator n=1 Tax=Zhenhengia yiwuensis TaxID=2763666 RepID=A0A926ECG1_9FIRM|nr:MarR family transcriptional regulator [Zhenhengia yiwuensis]MBC8578426.1 MarR family transcriptional regulator [Zhenhengia yiwuensis]MBS5798448.1 MarR family transcriptional regulator [Clostridiales bacterium]
MENKFSNIRGNTLHMALINVGHLHRRRSSRYFEKLDLSHAQPKILDFLSENDGCIQREIAVHCAREAATMTSILGIMEKSGLIERRPNPKDRRILNVFLTQKGKDIQKNIGETFSQLDKECLEGFSEEEYAQLIDYLERIYNNMNRREQEDA